MIGYNPSGTMTLPFGGGFNSFAPQLAAQQKINNPLLAQVLRMIQETQAANDARLAEKSATFDPRAHYATPGAPPPYFMGLSAMQRYRDMQMRNVARQEAAAAAVKAVQEKQAAEAAMTQEEKDARGGITREVHKPFNASGDLLPEFTTLKTPYGTASNESLDSQNATRALQGLPPIQKSMFIPDPAVPLKGNAVRPMGGKPMMSGDLQEYFQRAVNAGSPNAAALGMAPQAGYPGGPAMTALDTKLWELATKKKK